MQQWLVVVVNRNIVRAIAFVCLICVASCARVTEKDFDDQYVHVRRWTPMTVHGDSSFTVKVKGTRYSFSSVSHRVMPYYIRLTALDAILVPTWAAHSYDINFHVVYLKRDQCMSIPGGQLHFGDYVGYRDFSKINEANYVESMNENELVLVSVGESIAEGRYKEITTLDLKSKTVKSSRIIPNSNK